MRDWFIRVVPFSASFVREHIMIWEQSIIGFLGQSICKPISSFVVYICVVASREIYGDESWWHDESLNSAQTLGPQADWWSLIRSSPRKSLRPDTVLHQNCCVAVLLALPCFSDEQPDMLGSSMIWIFSKILRLQIQLVPPRRIFFGSPHAAGLFSQDGDKAGRPTLVIYWGYPPTSDPISSKSGSLAA